MAIISTKGSHDQTSDEEAGGLCVHVGKMATGVLQPDVDFSNGSKILLSTSIPESKCSQTEAFVNWGTKVHNKNPVVKYINIEEAMI